MQLGVVDDIAVLAETDLKNKEKIVQRKSLYAQMQSQIAQQDDSIKDLTGTIETLERQLVQAGIKGKVMQAEVEINKKKEEVKSGMNKTFLETAVKQKNLQNRMSNNAELFNARQGDILQNVKKDLDNKSKKE